MSCSRIYTTVLGATEKFRLVGLEQVSAEEMQRRYDAMMAGH